MTFLICRIAVFTMSFLVVVTSQALASERTGLSAGNEFEAVNIRGDISVHCHDSREGLRVVTHRCSLEILDPSEYSYFQTERGISADKVTLKAKHADGSSRTKSSRFDSNTGRSRSEFNLWIHTLFQRPLLEAGRNKVEYKLERDNRVVKTGNFEVNVRRKADRVCPRGSYVSHRMDDCRMSASICDRYFHEYNYCQ